jgi:type VII secretion integral membrane protein EccD
MPELPERPEDMLDDKPTPKRSAVFAAANRAHQLLNGLLLAASVATLVCTLMLLTEPSRWAVLLAVAATAAILLRARLFPTARQRLPMLISGISTAGVLAWATVSGESPTSRLVSWMVIISFVAGLVFAAGLVFSRRSPSPRLGRISDILEVTVIMALVPLACGVVGLYQRLQGVFAGVV